MPQQARFQNRVPETISTDYVWRIVAEWRNIVSVTAFGCLAPLGCSRTQEFFALGMIDH